MVALPPMRRTVRAESMAALPPPMMATFEPDCNLVVARYGLKERQRGIDILQLGAGQVEPGLLPGSDGEEDGVEAAGELVERKVEADAGVEDHFHADGLNEIEFAAENGLGQPVLGNGEAQHAAGFAALFKDGDVVAEHGEIEGGGEAGGACAGDGDFAAGGRQACAPMMRWTMGSKRSD